MSKSPFLPQGGSSRRARALARRRRRRRRVLAIGTMAVVVGAIAAVLVLTHSSLTHGSPSAAHTEGTRSDPLSHHGRGASSTASSTSNPDAVSGSPGASGSSGSPTAKSSGSGASTLSPAGLPLGRPPLTLDLSGTEDPVQASFHHPPSAGLLFDLSTGRVLWQLNPQEHLHIASLTKMMTALRVVRTSSPDAPVLVTKAAVASAGSKVGVLPLGKDVRLETMLYGLLLPSGNDAAVALAQHVSGSEGAFVASMNQEAAHLGMGCTHYTSPSGYFNARNYSCAADLAELAHVDLEQPLIARIVRTEKAVEPLADQGREGLPVQQQSAARLRISRRHGPEDRLHRTGRRLPGRNRRAPRREVGRGAPAFARTGAPSRVPAGPGLQGRLRPGTDCRATGAGRPLSPNLAWCGDSEPAGVVWAQRGVALLSRH